MFVHSATPSKAGWLRWIIIIILATVLILILYRRAMGIESLAISAKDSAGYLDAPNSADVFAAWTDHRGPRIDHVAILDDLHEIKRVQKLRVALRKLEKHQSAAAHQAWTKLELPCESENSRQRWLIYLATDRNTIGCYEPRRSGHLRRKEIGRLA